MNLTANLKYIILYNKTKTTENNENIAILHVPGV